MKGDPVPPPDHVARHCRYTDLIWHGGQSVAVTEAAFRPRAGEDDGLSVNWVEFFLGSRPHNLLCVRSVTKLQVKDSHRIALIQVEDLTQAAAPIANLSVVQDPDENLPPQANAAHALIRPIANLQDTIVRQRIASRVKPGDLYPYKLP
jgi:hypothetical protein